LVDDAEFIRADVEGIAPGVTVVVVSAETGEGVPGLTVSTAAVPELTVAEAAERLDLTGQPFVFFTDTASGRGTTAWSP
ncbi:hypothetical protein ABZ885_26425, partial [Kitasatospora sp. NPDC047058]